MSILTKNRRWRVLLTCMACLLMCHGAMFANVFSVCSVNRKTLEWGEPCLIKLSVYTHTWFSEGVVFPDMKNQQGVLIRNGRSYTLQETKGEERFSVVIQEYWYYPLKAGEQQISFEDFNVNSPAEGEYKGKDRTIKVTPCTIKVQEERPEQMNRTVAEQLNVTQRFDIPDSLKLGDVITREVNYRATGVPAAFVTPVKLSSKNSSYTIVNESPEFSTSVSNGKVYGKVKSNLFYQITDTGRIVIPPVRISYWNRVRKEVQTVTLDGKELYAMASDWQLNNGEAVAVKDEMPSSRNIIQFLPWLLLLVPVVVLFFGVRYLYRSEKVRFFFSVLYCRDDMELYDLLFLYCRKFTHYPTFEEYVRQMSKDMQQWYSGFLRSTFSQDRPMKTGCLERLRLAVILCKVKHHKLER